MESVGVGLLGLGTVGTAVAARLIERMGVARRARRCDTGAALRCGPRHLASARRRPEERPRCSATPEAVVDDPAVAIVVEAIGGTDPATALIESALRAGKTVVTANKAVIAASGPRLAALAAEHGARLYFEATVGAGLPIVALLRDEPARRSHLRARLRHQRHHQRHPHADARPRV